MANNQNLKPWKPGVSGNPDGKPKGTTHLSTKIRSMLNDTSLASKLSVKTSQGQLPIEAIIATLIQKAIDGDVRAFEALAKYGYGSKLDVTSQGQTLPTPPLVGLIPEIDQPSILKA